MTTSCLLSQETNKNLYWNIFGLWHLASDTFEGKTE